MVKITNKKVGTVSVKAAEHPIAWVRAEYSDGNSTIFIHMSGGGSSFATSLDKAELTELIEMLQQFAEYLEE